MACHLLWFAGVLTVDSARVQTHSGSLSVSKSGGRAGSACVDADNGNANTWGDSCSKYGHGWDQTSCGMFDTENFTSGEMCCSCGGGTHGACHDTNLLKTSTCACVDADNGNANTWGDNCSKYGNDWGQTSCGMFDTENFKSGEMCCSCGGGTQGECHDTNLVTTNTFDDGCSAYGNFFGDDSFGLTSCGMFDKDEFNSVEMCCACGGGSYDPLPAPTPTITTTTTTTTIATATPTTAPALCEDHTCGLGKVLTGHGGCDATSCVDEQCCELEALCEDHTCGVGKVLTGSGGCDATSCADTQCCEPEAQCADHTCGLGQLPTFSGGCDATSCLDMQCCQPEAQCEDHACGVGKVLTGSGGCDATSCADTQCCEPEAQCADHTCDVGTILTGSGGCDATSCTDTQCCEAMDEPIGCYQNSKWSSESGTYYNTCAMTPGIPPSVKDWSKPQTPANCLALCRNYDGQTFTAAGLQGGTCYCGHQSNLWMRDYTTGYCPKLGAEVSYSGGRPNWVKKSAYWQCGGDTYGGGIPYMTLSTSQPSIMVIYKVSH